MITNVNDQLFIAVATFELILLSSGNHPASYGVLSLLWMSWEMHLTRHRGGCKLSRSFLAMQCEVAAYATACLYVTLVGHA